MAVKTVLDVIDIIYQGLNGTALDLMITGAIYKLDRPVASSLEDVIINCLPIDNNQLQTAIANVNIYVPDIGVKVNNVAEKYPNYVRLKLLAKLGYEALSNIWIEDFDYDVQQSGIIEDDESDAHYINIRVEFNSENF